MAPKDLRNPSFQVTQLFRGGNKAWARMQDCRGPTGREGSTEREKQVPSHSRLSLVCKTELDLISFLKLTKGMQRGREKPVDLEAGDRTGKEGNGWGGVRVGTWRCLSLSRPDLCVKADTGRAWHRRRASKKGERGCWPNLSQLKNLCAGITRDFSQANYSYYHRTPLLIHHRYSRHRLQRPNKDNATEL